MSIVCPIKIFKKHAVKALQTLILYAIRAGAVSAMVCFFWNQNIKIKDRFVHQLQLDAIAGSGVVYSGLIFKPIICPDLLSPKQPQIAAASPLLVVLPVGIARKRPPPFL